ncbi:hypothetical protein TGMAS_413250 [Toxoplasma gondii MAS]|uniref:Uncharacterized protein n=1 Tax=Toxoplasma gondii MAS TaxID=943118 RepID=A0A086QW31_TOXGO|nr:hypothetical protein TGMAS_413250 [Toxoplasma gondii MAS]
MLTLSLCSSYTASTALSDRRKWRCPMMSSPESRMASRICSQAPAPTASGFIIAKVLSTGHLSTEEGRKRKQPRLTQPYASLYSLNCLALVTVHLFHLFRERFRCMWGSCHPLNRVERKGRKNTGNREEGETEKTGETERKERPGEWSRREGQQTWIQIERGTGRELEKRRETTEEAGPHGAASSKLGAHKGRDYRGSISLRDRKVHPSSE